MKKTFYTIILILMSYNSFAQNQILNENDIPKLNSIIKSLEEDVYEKNKTSVYESLPQANANCFLIVTSSPKEFVYALQNAENFQQLADQFPNLQIDKNLLIIKNIYTDYKKEKKLEIKSFEIKNNRNHLVSLKFSDSLNQNTIKYFYSSRTGKTKNTTTIFGFYLNNNFKSVSIPEKYADWLHYTDILVKPETKLFLGEEKSSSEGFSSTRTIIDSLVTYYELKTKKPPYKKEQDYISRSKDLDAWQSKKQLYADSLFKKDNQFKKLLNEALVYAEKNKVSNRDLEDFTSYLISKERALNLMRQNQQVGSGSYDNSPITQQKRIANLAAQTQNWEVFIQSFLNVMNDNVSRVANSNIASNARETYINELSKLDLDLNKILMGSNLRIEDTINNHYFSDGSKIAKAYASLDADYQQYFEKTIHEILSNKSMDAFNKLHFYNTYSYYQYFLEDSLKIKSVENNIANLIPLLPDEIKSRLENPNKQLQDLLHKEKKELDKFEISYSIIANVYSYSYAGDCWQADLVDKGTNGKIIYDLTMPIGEIITPLNNFLVKKNDLKSRVESHQFLQKILNTNKENQLYIEFTDDKSFANYRETVTSEIPKELASKLDFNDAISLYIMNAKRNYVRYVLLKNNNLLVLGIPKDFTLPGYSFEDLMTEKKDSFFSTSYKSFKLFNHKGKMLN